MPLDPIDAIDAILDPIARDALPDKTGARTETGGDSILSEGSALPTLDAVIAALTRAKSPGPAEAKACSGHGGGAPAIETKPRKCRKAPRRPRPRRPANGAGQAA